MRGRVVPAGVAPVRLIARTAGSSRTLSQINFIKTPPLYAEINHNAPNLQFTSHCTTPTRRSPIDAKSKWNDEMKLFDILYHLFYPVYDFHKHMAMNIWILYIQYQSKQYNVYNKM